MALLGNLGKWYPIALLMLYQPFPIKVVAYLLESLRRSSIPQCSVPNKLEIRLQVLRGLALTSAISLTLGHKGPAIAQITPDGTLSTTVTSTDGLNFVIDAGDVCCTSSGQHAGPNLFHCFDQFSIPTHGAAHFNNALSVENIISRVTGRTISNIDGYLTANGTANVFLLNPNGLIFGPNARLDIGGSFFASTGDRLMFADGSEFRTDSQSRPLLTLSTPIGLQIGQDSGPITIQGPGHQLIHTRDFFAVQNVASQPLGLRVNPGKTLSLIGSDITLNGAILSAASGHIELGSLDTGLVQWNDEASHFTYDTSQFQDLHLLQRSLLEVSGLQSGSVQLKGANVLLASGATVLAQQSGGQTGGVIALNGTESVRLRGTAPGGTPRTQIRTETSGTGTGGLIEISTPLLHLSGASGVLSSTFGPADGGYPTLP